MKFITLLTLILLNFNTCFSQYHSKNYLITGSMVYTDTTLSGNVNSINPLLNTFTALGVVPFKINFGVGFFLLQNTEINIQYSNMALPLSMDVDIFSAGIRSYFIESRTVYSLSAGGTFPRKSISYSLDGICIETSVGYLLKFGRMFYFLPSIKAGSILREKRNPQGIIGIDLTLGIYIN